MNYWQRSILAGAAVVVALPIAPVAAEFVATGPIKGQVCRGFVIEACKFHVLHAVKGDSGQLFTIRDRYERVSEHRDGCCWIRTKSKGAGLISWGANIASQPEFYERTAEGAYNKLDIEYVVFPCQERN